MTTTTMSKEELSPIVKTKQGIYVLMAKPEVGKSYIAKCPVCGSFVDIVAKHTNPDKVTCSCKAVIAFVGTPALHVTPQNDNKDENVQEQKEAEQPVPTEKFAKRKKSKRNGIIFWGTWPFKHSYVLSKGSNTIGREDEEEPSDIQLKDSYVSRRSIDIEVLDSESGYLFKLTVRKATNPVYINGQEHDEGTSIYLNDGDTIHLGSKKLRFALEDKK